MRHPTDKRRPDQAQLDQMIERAKEEQAKECQSWHPEINKRCLRPAGHRGRHRWWYDLWSKTWEW
jgi:hypothetical protein